MSSKEQGRIRMLNLVLEDHMTVGDGSGDDAALGSPHPILAAYRKEGAQAVVHGNRGRSPAHTIDRQTRARVITLAQEYAEVNDSRLTEVLAEDEGIRLTRLSARRDEAVL